MQQTVNLNLILDQVAKDKGIDRQRLVEILEESIGSAAKRHFGLERNLKARYDEDKGQVDLFQVLTIVHDPTEENPLPDPVNMVPVSMAHEKGIEVDPGDELDFPIYYRTEDEAEAKAQDEQWGDLL
jgi:N utilization substance protein A